VAPGFLVTGYTPKKSLLTENHFPPDTDQFIMNHNSGDEKEVGVAHEVKLPENQP